MAIGRMILNCSFSWISTKVKALVSKTDHYTYSKDNAVKMTRKSSESNGGHAYQKPPLVGKSFLRQGIKAIKKKKVSFLTCCARLVPLPHPVGHLGKKYEPVGMVHPAGDDWMCLDTTHRTYRKSNAAGLEKAAKGMGFVCTAWSRDTTKVLVGQLAVNVRCHFNDPVHYCIS